MPPHDDSERIYQGIETEALMTFQQPSDAAFEQIRHILEQVEIRPSTDELPEQLGKGCPVVVGSLAIVMDRIRRMIESDHSINSRECREWNGSFEYGVGFTNLHDDLDIWTRLYSTERGSVYYASSIRRLAPDKFAVVDRHTDLGE